MSGQADLLREPLPQPAIVHPYLTLRRDLTRANGTISAACAAATAALIFSRMLIRSTRPHRQSDRAAATPAKAVSTSAKTRQRVLPQ